MKYFLVIGSGLDINKLLHFTKLLKNVMNEKFPKPHAADPLILTDFNIEEIKLQHF